MQQKHPDPICTKLIQLLKYSVTNDKIKRRVLYTIYKSRRSLEKGPLAKDLRGHGLAGKGPQRSRSHRSRSRRQRTSEVTVS